MDAEQVKGAVAAVAGTRATVRIDGNRIGVVIDASGLDNQARDALEASVRMAASVPGLIDPEQEALALEMRYGERVDAALAKRAAALAKTLAPA